VALLVHSIRFAFASFYMHFAQAVATHAAGSCCCIPHADILTHSSASCTHESALVHGVYVGVCAARNLANVHSAHPHSCAADVVGCIPGWAAIRGCWLAAGKEVWTQVATERLGCFGDGNHDDEVDWW
jgi:hypothetical protein